MRAFMTSERRAASELQAKLRGGEFVVTAEITPPVSTDPAEFLRRALPLKGLASAVNVTDGAGAKVHLSSLAAAHFLMQSGIEPIFQMTCRDRNRLALQGDILGAEALGIRNMLVLAGDDPKAGDQPEAKPVFDLDSRKLLSMADQMRRTRKLPPGTPIAGKLDVTIDEVLGELGVMEEAEIHLEKGQVGGGVQDPVAFAELDAVEHAAIGQVDDVLRAQVPVPVHHPPLPRALLEEPGTKREERELRRGDGAKAGGADALPLQRLDVRVILVEDLAKHARAAEPAFRSGLGRAAVEAQVLGRLPQRAPFERLERRPQLVE